MATQSGIKSAAEVAAKVSPPDMLRAEGLSGVTSFDEAAEKRVDEIEMIGEEEAAGLARVPHSEVTPGMRYLHCSRTIHQLVTDRNRAVGIYLAVASLLWTASTALLNARHNDGLIVPIETLQRACLPVTFGVLTVLAVFVSLLLIRTRVGLIYEVAKMNALLGLPPGRVQRVNPFSIFFILHLFISLAGGGTAALLAYHLFAEGAPWASPAAGVRAGLVGLVVSLLLTALYVGTVLITTADRRLQGSVPR